MTHPFVENAHGDPYCAHIDPIGPTGIDKVQCNLPRENARHRTTDKQLTVQLLEDAIAKQHDANLANERLLKHLLSQSE